MRSRISKKGVSPVVGVILLIALTVAMVGVMWAVVVPLFQAPVLITVETTDTSLLNGSATWQGVINIDGHKGILAFVLGNVSHSVDSVDSTYYHEGTGDISYNVGFNGIAEGQYSLIVTLDSNGKFITVSHSVGFS